MIMITIQHPIILFRTRKFIGRVPAVSVGMIFVFITIIRIRIVHVIKERGTQIDSVATANAATIDHRESAEKETRRNTVRSNGDTSSALSSCSRVRFWYVMIEERYYSIIMNYN